MPTYGQTMTIAQPGKINVQHWRGNAIYQNGMRIISPFFQDLTPSSNPYPGNTFTSTAVYPVGTVVVVELYNVGGGGGPTKRNDTVYAQFSDGYNPGYTWQINWEDGGIGTPDFDYNDSFTYIYTTGAGNINLSRIRYRAYDLGVSAIPRLPKLFSADNTNFYSVNGTTGVETLIGPHGLGVGVESLCYCHKTFTMYGTTKATGSPARSKLFTINYRTGSTTIIGTFPTTNLVFEDIAINRETGQMYGITDGENSIVGIWTIDKELATAELLNTFTPPFSGALYRKTGGIDFDSNGVLWGTVKYNVVIIDPDTGVATLQDTIAGNYDKQALTFDENDIAYHTYDVYLEVSVDLTDIDTTLYDNTLSTSNGEAIAWAF